MVVSMTTPASAYTGGTGENKKVPPEPRLATVAMPANSCSHPTPSSRGAVSLSERMIPQAKVLL